MPEKPAYDLFVLIDADAPEERRTGIIEAVRKQIESGDGALKGDADWGVRKLAYEIEHRPEAYYHLFQIEAGPELLKQLEHSLAIEDGVLRHRVIRLPKGVPESPPRPPAAARQAAPAAPESEAAEPTPEEEQPG
jgi:small subunit ribosomal protein S6